MCNIPIENLETGRWRIYRPAKRAVILYQNRPKS